MREHQKNRRAAVRGRTKRYLVAAIAIVLTLALSATALADNGRGGGKPEGQGSGTQTQPGGGQDRGEASVPGQSEKQDGKHNAQAEGLNVEKIEEAISALTDEDAKTSLTTLLNAYVTAWTAKQEAIAAKDTDTLATLTETMTAAKTALDAALESAGISIDTLYGEPEQAKDGTGKMNNRPALDTEEIEAAIAALADTDENKTTLTGLLSSYEAALAAQAAADTSTLSEEELQVLADAVQSAEEALLEAARSAGVIGGEGRGQFVSGYAYGKAELNADAISAQIAALDDTNENKAQLSELLAAYQTALTAEQSADVATLTEEEQAALQNATKSAADALKEALENAGLDTQIQNRAQEEKNYELQVVSGTDASADNDGGVVESFFSWLKSLFQ